MQWRTTVVGIATLSPTARKTHQLTAVVETPELPYKTAELMTSILGKLLFFQLHDTQQRVSLEVTVSPLTPPPSPKDSSKPT